MDNIAKYKVDHNDIKYARRHKHSMYYRLPRDIIRKYIKEPTFEHLIAISSGYRSGPNRLMAFNVRKKPSQECFIKICIDGEGWFEADGMRTVIKPGDLIICNDNLGHSYGTNMENPWTVYWVYFQCDYMDYLFPNLKEKRYQIIPLTDDMTITNHLRTIMQHMERGYATPYLYTATARLSVLLAYVQDIVNHHSVEAVHRFDAVIQYMSDNLDITLPVDTLAEITELSKDHFIKVFHEKYGYTPIDYFIRLKMQKACEQLTTTEDPIKSVASELGYTDYYYFSRIFKQKIGMSPRTYRSSHAM